MIKIDYMSHSCTMSDDLQYTTLWIHRDEIVKQFYDYEGKFPTRRRRMLLLYLAWLRRFEEPSERDKFLRDRFRTKEK